MNEQEMMRKHQKRKDRIKNIAILFLTVMLLLTFFSNTIMNYSLAEVGSAYATSGTLTTKIRGDGFVEAKDPVQVKTDKTSEVLKVYVKNGDKVKKGQTMFVLEGSTVSELKQAQADLMTLQYEYEKALLEMQVPDYGKNNLDIKYAKKDLEDALQNIKDTKKEISKKETEYKKLKEKADAAKKNMEKKADAVADKALEISETEMKLEEYTNEQEALDAQTNEDIEAKEAALTAAKRVQEDAQTAYDEAKEAESAYESGSDRTSEVIAGEIKEKKRTIADLQKELASLRSSLTAAEGGKGETAQEKTEAIEELNADIYSNSTKILALESNIANLKKECSEAKTEEEKTALNLKIETMQENLDSLKITQQECYKNLTKLQNQLKKAIEEEKKTITASISVKEEEYNNASQDLKDLETEKVSADTRASNLTAARAKTAECKTALKKAATAQLAAERALEDAQAALKKENAGEREALKANIKETKTEKVKLENQKTKLDAAYAEAQEVYNTAKAAADAFQKADETAMDTVNQAADEKRKALEALYLELASAKTDDYLKQQLSNLDSSQKKKQIEQKKKEIAKLKKKKKPVRIKAKQAGIVGNVSVKAGDTTVPETALAEIQLKKNGFKLSIPVTIEQSKLVKRGDHASVLNIWDDDMKVVLSEIRTDSENSNAGRTLVFDVSGNVENGTSLSIAVGERTANYDLIVPTSAIREDSNGKFVLIIEEKSSPVGNRYIARKEEISVITQDETQSAITGGFDSYTSIITTSSKSVEPGDYVRLSA